LTVKELEIDRLTYHSIVKDGVVHIIFIIVIVVIVNAVVKTIDGILR